jgi:hypothetical protein
MAEGSQTFINEAWPWLLLTWMAVGTVLFIGLAAIVLTVHPGSPSNWAFLVALALEIIGLVAFLTWTTNLSVPKELMIDEFGLKGTITYPALMKRGMRHIEIDFSDITSVSRWPPGWWVRSRFTGSIRPGHRGIFLSRENVDRVERAWEAWRIGRS